MADRDLEEGTRLAVLTGAYICPGYAPDLNAVEGAWSVMKIGLSNHAAATLRQLDALVRNRLRAIQRRPGLINALLGQTGLTLDPPPQTLAFQPL